MSGKRKGPGGGRPGGRSEDPWQDPGLLRWMKRCETELVPMIRNSRMGMSLVPSDEGVDLKFAIELGLMIMMDKPIIAVIMPGRKVPEHLVRVSDSILEFDDNDPAGNERRMLEAMKRLGLSRDDSGYVAHLRENPPPIEVPDELDATPTEAPNVGPPARYELTDPQIAAVAEKLEDYFTDAVHIDANLVGKLIKAYGSPVQGDDDGQ